jgi:hypothetical protein
MAVLQLAFHCLCLYVRDDENRTVHVLMPSTRGHHPHHFAEFQHPSFGGERNARSIEGWALVLPAAGGATAHTRSLDPRQDREILDVTAATAAEVAGGVRVKRELVTGRSDAVKARITLRAGQVTDTVGEAFWKFDGRKVEMVTHVLWEMEIEDVEARLEWHPIGAGGDPPLVSLSALGREVPLENVPGRDEGRMGYRLDVYHSTLSELKPKDVAHHFRAFYEQLLKHAPTASQLPHNAQEGPTVHCGSAQALLE